MEGWIKLHRCLLHNPIVMKDAEYLAVWSYLLLKATHTDYQVLFKGEKTTLHQGQLITGRKKIASDLHIHESKVFRILKDFKREQQIEQQTSNQNSLISIVNWELYQGSEQPNEQPMNNERTTSEQRVNTNKNIKNIKNEKNIDNMSNKELDELRSRFEQLAKNYRSVHDNPNGKSKARDKYIKWCTAGCKVDGKNVKFTPEQIENAFGHYVQDHINKEERGEWVPPYKNIDTIMNNIMDWVEE